MNTYLGYSECGKHHMIPGGVNLSSGLLFDLFLLYFALDPQSGTYCLDYVAPIQECHSRVGCLRCV